jgi:hypothetical protein
MSEMSKCNRCGAPLPPDSPEGFCPRCLIALNLATQTEMAGETGPTKPPPSPPLPVAEVAKLFPQLDILECLGRGGMGAVYKARQLRLDRLVALKIISPEKQGNQKFAGRFEREARALARLHHPNIVTVYDFGEVQGNFYLLMEFVDGLTLRQLLQARKLSPAEALTIVPKICEALQYAHEQGIVHRDIKPENILMDKEGRVKIADFGIAKILGDGGRGNLTEEQAIGTPHYMSPEQIEHPQAVDHRADIYSLGVVFYEMLTGELPLGKFQPPSKKVHIDVRLDEIVLRALEKEPERRYQQVSEVKTQVETVAATPEVGRSQGDEAQIENQSSLTPAATKKSGLVRIVEIFFDITFKSRLAIRLLNFSALGFLGSLGFLGYLPRMQGCFGFFGLYGLFGLIGLAFIVEFFVRHKSSAPASQQKPDHFWRRFAVVVVALISIPFLIAILGLLAAIAIPAFVKGRQHALALREQQVAVKSDYIGQTWFPLGDSIEITSVERTTNQMTVKGYYNLVSHDDARLKIHITASHSGPTPADPEQEIKIFKGRGDFELIHPHVVPGLPHVSMYGSNGHTFATVYFGTKDEAEQESAADWITNSPSFSVIEPQEAEPDDLLKARAKLAELRVYLGEKNPDVQEALARVNELERMLKEEPNASPELREAKAHLAELRVDYGRDNPVLLEALAKVKALEDSNNNQYVNSNHPQIISIWPANGATNVDPTSVADIHVVFDQPMMDHSWSMTGGGIHYPNITGDIHYDSKRTTWIAPVKLKPGWRYEFGLNSESYQNFKSADGVPLDPVYVTFQTSGQSLEPVDLPPKVVSMTPPNGATNVDQNLAEIKVVFDQPMEDGAWSMCDSDTDTNFPAGPGPVHYDATQTIWTAPVDKLRRGTKYEFWLNWGNYRNFRSAKGVSLEPVDVTFTTAQ